MTGHGVGLNRDELRSVAAQLLLRRAQQLADEDGITVEEASRKGPFAMTEAVLEYVILLIEANNRRLAEQLNAERGSPNNPG